METMPNEKQYWEQWHTENNNGNSGKLKTMMGTVAN
jgi:hypothetical protein